MAVKAPGLVTTVSYLHNSRARFLNYLYSCCDFVSLPAVVSSLRVYILQ